MRCSSDGGLVCTSVGVAYTVVDVTLDVGGVSDVVVGDVGSVDGSTMGLVDESNGFSCGVVSVVGG